MNKKQMLIPIVLISVILGFLTTPKLVYAGALEDLYAGKIDPNIPGPGPIVRPATGPLAASATETKDNALSASDSKSASGSTSTATNTNNINIINQIPQQPPVIVQQVQPRPDVKILSPTINFGITRSTPLHTNTHANTHFVQSSSPVPCLDIQSTIRDAGVRVGAGFQQGYADGQKDWSNSSVFDNDPSNNGAKHTSEYAHGYREGYSVGWNDASHGIHTQPC